jgi:DNA polymerase I-like protein with 3'-5' exonuclease and polymerase domains
MITIDFETEAIVFGSATPPKPVGLAIRDEEGYCQYLAFGHPTENNTDWDYVGETLARLWASDQMIIGHNLMGFDKEVAEYWFKLPYRDHLLFHDTLFQAYLIDANTPSLKLKDLAANWLGMPADGQEALQNWILANVPECRTRKQTGEYICRAPGNLVGEYAMDDVRMTFALHEYCIAKLAEMEEPYDRELKLSPILARIQRGGIRVNDVQLAADYEVAIEKLHDLDDKVRKELSAPNLNPGSSKELIRALQQGGYEGFLLTPTGAPSANKESLAGVLRAAPELSKLLHSRATYATLTGTFMHPWLELCKLNGGTINPSYNQVRNPEGFGTRTGRLSSTNPNGQNIPVFEGIDWYGDPFPLMRSYCLPDADMVWYSVDFKAQEPRLAAHFEDGLLMEAFCEDVNLDPYIFVMQLVGGDVTRKDAKVVFLGLLYSMGAAALADKLGCDTARATALRNAIRAAIPDINSLDRDCKRRFEMGLPIKTLGGRFVHCEPPSNGRVWAYKALNLLIQGSAADQTKEAIIYADDQLRARKIPSRLLGTVHDEINLCAPAKCNSQIEDVMQEAANALPCDVFMGITMGVGNNWAEASK